MSTSERERAFAQMIEKARQENPQKYAHWDATLFERFFTESYGEPFSQSIINEDNAFILFDAFLQCLSEMIGRKYITNAEEFYEVATQNIMSRIFSQNLWWYLEKCPTTRRPQALAKAWNLCEGVMNAPVWIQQTVEAKIYDLGGLLHLETFLTETLEPAIVQPESADWHQKCSLHILNTRETSEAFIPGHMHFVTPNILCVHDLRNDDSHVGLFLKKSGKSSFIGETGCLGSTLSAKILPEYQFSNNLITIEGQDIPLDFLGTQTNHVLSDAGYLVINTTNSQQLWIVESA